MTEPHITLGPQTLRFDNPYSTAFIEHVRGRVHREAEAFAAYVYNLPRATWEYTNLTKRIIVDCLIGGFPNRLNDPVITNDWPDVICALNADRTSGRIVMSWMPETDAYRGGIAIDAVDFKVKAAPPNAAKRMIRGILGALKIGQKTLADPEDNLAPVGTPDGRPKSQSARAESPKPAQRDPAPAAHPQPPARRSAPVTPQSPPESNWKASYSKPASPPQRPSPKADMLRRAETTRTNPADKPRPKR